MTSNETPAQARARRALLRAALAAPAALAGAGARSADEAFPSKQVRIVVSVGPGTGADLIARSLAENLAPLFGRPVIVDNRPGADGAVAMQALLAAPPDGHTIAIISSGSIILNPLTMQGLTYKLGDVRPLVGSARVTGLFTTGANSRFTSMKAALEAAAREPGRVTIGTYGGIYRMAAAGIERAAGVSLNHLSYKGLAPVTNDLVGGSLDLALVDAGTATPMVTGGRLRGLAVTSSQRLPGLPDVPTLREAEAPPLGIGIWVGTGIHRGTPEPLAVKLEQAVQKAMTADSWHALLRRLGSLEHWPVGLREFATVVAADTEYFKANLDLLGAR